MPLSNFIRENRPAITDEWQAFAKTLRPSADMTELQLTDHIDELLTFIADDIETVQSDKQQFDKSQGTEDSKSTVETAAQVHAALRHQDGFDIIEMVSEYRALRATVTKLWTRARKTLTEDDMDDLGRFNEAIDQALAESVQRFTEDVNKAKDLLLGVLGHDIRSPVAAIQMVADLVPRTGALNPEQTRLLQQIKPCTDRVQHIVRDLIDLAKSGAGQILPMAKSDFSLSDLCTQIVDETRLRHPDHEIVLILPGPVEGHWDAIRLGQLLGNLLSNAVQYGAPDQPIMARLTDHGADIVLAVTNSGRPIPSAHLDTIFKSFARVPGVDGEREVPTSNLGLGLFISKEISAAHGGTISVESTESDGTTFSVRLPKFIQGAP